MFNDQPIIPDEHFFELVRLGQETEKFLKHDTVGKMLSERALLDYQEAIFAFEKLTVVEILESPQKVAAIKQRMDTAKAFLIWTNSTIQAAKRAEEELHNRDMSDEAID